jgi:hypothetical protein
MEDSDEAEWKILFDSSKDPSRDLEEYARVLAAKVLLGAKSSEEMDEDGKLSYELQRPIGGHGKCFLDVLYQDDDLRIARGHLDSILVQSLS